MLTLLQLERVALDLHSVNAERCRFFLSGTVRKPRGGNRSGQKVGKTYRATCTCVMF